MSMSRSSYSDSHLDREHALGIERAETLLRGVLIPPRPAVLLQVLEEQRKPDPDLSRITDLISSDVALAAGTLKVVNSPFFGLQRKVGSVRHAVRLLGIGNIVQLVTGLMLHSAFSQGKSRFMDEFWGWSNQLAMLCALAAREARIVPEDAYTLGLFADCGVPLLLRRFPDYPKVFTAAQGIADATATAYEDKQIGTDHAAVGYMIGKSWKLPDAVCHCILRHHDAVDYYGTKHEAVGEATPMLAVLVLAVHLLRSLHGLPVSYEWTRIGDAVKSCLGMSDEQIAALAAEARDMFSAMETA